MTIYVLRSIKTCTVDKAAIISSRQLLLLLYINLSLSHLEFPTFFTSRRYNADSTTFSECIMALSCSTARDLFFHCTLTYHRKCSHISHFFRYNYNKYLIFVHLIPHISFCLWFKGKLVSITAIHADFLLSSLSLSLSLPLFFLLFNNLHI